MAFSLFKKKKNKLIIQIISLILINIFVLVVATNIYFDSSKAIETLSKLGSRGDEVRQIQTKLKQLGYYKGTVDGIYGTLTKKAVMNFQKRNCGTENSSVSRTVGFVGRFVQ